MARTLFTVDEIDLDKLPLHGVKLSGTYRGYITSLMRTDGSETLLMAGAPAFDAILTACRKPLGGDDNSGWSPS